MSDNKTLTTKQVAKRWNMHHITLAKWRVYGGGPEFIKTGRCVNYTIESIEEFEAKRKMENTSQYYLLVRGGK